VKSDDESERRVHSEKSFHLKEFLKLLLLASCFGDGVLVFVREFFNGLGILVGENGSELMTNIECLR
jgi:hypothetical protein